MPLVIPETFIFFLLNMMFKSAMESCQYESYTYIYLQFLLTIYTLTYPINSRAGVYHFILWVQPLLHDRDLAALAGRRISDFLTMIQGLPDLLGIDPIPMESNVIPKLEKLALRVCCFLVEAKPLAIRPSLWLTGAGRTLARGNLFNYKVAKQAAFQALRTFQAFPKNKRVYVLLTAGCYFCLVRFERPEGSNAELENMRWRKLLPTVVYGIRSMFTYGDSVGSALPDINGYTLPFRHAFKLCRMEPLNFNDETAVFGAAKMDMFEVQEDEIVDDDVTDKMASQATAQFRQAAIRTVLKRREVHRASVASWTYSPSTARESSTESETSDSYPTPQPRSTSDSSRTSSDDTTSPATPTHGSVAQNHAPAIDKSVTPTRKPSRKRQRTRSPASSSPPARNDILIPVIQGNPVFDMFNRGGTLPDQTVNSRSQAAATGAVSASDDESSEDDDKDSETMDPQDDYSDDELEYVDDEDMVPPQSEAYLSDGDALEEGYEDEDEDDDIRPLIPIGEFGSQSRRSSSPEPSPGRGLHAWSPSPIPGQSPATSSSARDLTYGSHGSQPSTHTPVTQRTHGQSTHSNNEHSPPSPIQNMHVRRAQDRDRLPPFSGPSTSRNPGTSR